MKILKNQLPVVEALMCNSAHLCDTTRLTPGGCRHHIPHIRSRLCAHICAYPVGSITLEGWCLLTDEEIV